MVASSIYYTDESRRFMEELLALAPGSQNGGLYANKPGYHNLRNNLIRQGLINDYSVRATVDKQGPGDKSAAYDWTFPEAQRGDRTRIRFFMTRIKVVFDARDPRLKGWREALGQQDLDSPPEGFDFDSWTTRTPGISHDWHIHLSEHRLFLADWANKEKMLSILSGTLWTPPDTGTRSPGSRELAKGANGTDVAFVQRYIGPARCGAADGDFGPNTESGVRWYQGMRGIQVDGIVGRETWRNMGVNPTY